MSIPRLHLFAAALVLLANSAQAAKPAAWRHRSADDFQKGTLEGLVVSAEGALVLADQMTELADLHATSVWGLARTPAGKLYAGTAVPGQLVEVADDGKNEVLWKHDQEQVFSLAAAADGTVYFGTGPKGHIYRLPSGGGKPERFAQLDGLYVWSLLVEPSGELVAATGPKGVIYKIAKDGAARVLCETGKQHVLALARRKDGAILAGTNGGGLVLSIDTTGKVSALYDTREDEVRSLWLDPSGILYAGTSLEKSDSSSKNHVYRISPDGSARSVFEAAGTFYALGSLGSGSDRSLLVGTGDPGKLYQFQLTGGIPREVAETDEELYLCMSSEREGQVVVGTGNPGKLFVVSARHVAEGTLVSPPLDAKLVSRFGRLSWQSVVPPGASVTLAVRSGYTETPDDSWSAWSAEEKDAETAQAQCPPGRFLQYRLTMKTTKPTVTPRVFGVAAYYLTSNQRPEIESFDVPHVEDGDGKKLLDRLKLEWDADDPNDDDLSYTLSFRKPEWKDWVALKRGLDVKSYDWDISAVPEGRYLLRLEASDELNNTPDETAVDTRVSELVTVDRSGPQIELKRDPAQTAGKENGDEAVNVTYVMTAKDTFSRITSAQFAVDGGKWQAMYPEDGILDSPRETFRLPLKLSPGTHVIVVRVTDAAGYTSSSDEVFTVK